MTSALTCEKFIESFACAHVNDGFLEEDGWNMMQCFMQIEESPLLKVRDLKDRGNALFKNNHFDNAAACYDEACKLLSLVVGLKGEYNINILSDLAVSLNLNLAACAIKLFEHEAAMDLCSLVLSSFPHNVKALFRRALAFMKLKMFLQAQSDLEKALLVEPKNKDILRELSVVNNHLAINCNGKRCMDVLNFRDEVREGKRQINTLESEGDYLMKDNDHSITGSCTRRAISGVESNNVSYSGISSLDVCETQSCATQNPDLDLDLKIETDHVGVHEKMLQFRRKGRGNFQLRISEQSYQKLLEGKEVSYGQNFQSTFMKLRILKPSKLESKKCLNTPSNNKRRRRRRRRPNKGNSSEKVTNDENLTSPSLDTSDILKSEIDSSQIVPTSLVEFNHTLLPTEDAINTNSFSSKQKIRKLSSIKRLLARKGDQVEQHQVHFPSIGSGTSLAFPLPIFRCNTTIINTTRFKKQICLERHPINFILSTSTTNVHPLILDSSEKKRRRVRQSRGLHAHSSTRFPCYWRTIFKFPRPKDVSLHCSIGKLSNAKRKSVHVPELLNSSISLSKKQCRGLNLGSSSMFHFTYFNCLVSNIICKFDSESLTAVL